MFEKKILPNGLKVVAERIPFVRSIALGIWVRNGSRNEVPDTNGISHFLEHMMFKGTEKRTAKDIADEMDAIGGQINAFTSKEYTCYYTRTLDSHIDIALGILSDMFLNSKFSDDDIEKEKGVVIEEINMYEDSPEELVHDMLQSSIWENDPLGYPILGTVDTVRSFNQTLLKQYHRSHYQPENTVIAIAGNFEYEDIYRKIEQYFRTWESKGELPDVDWDTPYNPRIVTREKDIEQIHVCLGFPGLSIGNEDVYALAILNTIFGGGMSSRLFQKIREEKGLAYSVYSYTANYYKAGLFNIYAGMNPVQTEEVIKTVIEEMQLMKDTKVMEKDIYKTKEQLKSNYIIGLESTSSRMTSLGKSELLLNRIQTPDELIRKIDEVNGEVIERLIHDIFDFSKISIAAVGKINNLNIEGIIKAYA